MRLSARLPLAALLALTAIACSAEREPRVGEPVGSHVGEIRPTDGTGWQGNGYGAVKVENWDTPGGRFRVHYTREGKHAVPSTDADKSGVPDFVEQFGKTFDEVLGAYEKLGFREPLSDEKYHDRPDYGGNARFDVYLQDQGKGADGYLVTEACASGVPPRCAGYMVVENDFVGYSYKTPQEGMKILASHEFFHAIQNAYRRGMVSSFSEGSAVWGTESVYPDTRDFEGFITRFFQASDRPIDDTPSSPADLFSYSTAIWLRYLSERFGEKTVPDVFVELSETGKSPTEIDAVHAVLSRDHKTTLEAAFAEFALWNLLTGDRAVAGEGYADAAGYPQVGVKKEAKNHPFRISGEIAYLSARYYELVANAGEQITVTSEREQPKLILHLVTGAASAPKIVSSKPGEKSVTIDAEGKVLLVAASTARSGGKQLPLSLVVTGKTVNPPAGDGGVTPPGGGDSGGCAVAAASPQRSAGLAGVLSLLLLGFVAGRRRRFALLCVALALVFGLSLSGCSDDSQTGNADSSAPDAKVADAGPDAGKVLALGEFVDVEADAQGVLKTTIPATGDEQFMVLLLSMDGTALAQYDYKVLGTQAARGALPWPGLPGAGALPDRKQCRFSRELARILETSRVPLAQAFSQQRSPYAANPPKVGDKRTFKVSRGVSVDTIDAEAIRVDGQAVFWIDKTTQPLATIDAADLKKLADDFGTIILPRERVYFGQESDVDGDGLIHVLLSALVQKGGAVAYVSPCDLVDPKLVPGCAASNTMELIYVTPPSALQPPYNTATALLETIAHEFQHTIYFYRKFVLNKSEGKNENPYITEGLSHLAQDLSGWQSGNLYVQLATLQSIDLVSVPNAVDKKISSYVPQPGDGVMRGAGYWLLRYLFDRAGGDALDAQNNPIDKGGIAFLHKLIDQPETGMESYLKASGLTYEELVTGFWTTMALSNRKAGGEPVSKDPKYNFLPTTKDPLTDRQRGADLFASFHATQMVGPATQELDKADGKLRSGGAEFLLAKPAAGAKSFSVHIEANPALKARARIIRIR